MIDGSYANNVVDFLNFCELRGAAVSEECLEAWMKVMKAAGVEEAINHSTTTAALRMLTRLLGKRNGESVG